MKYPYHNNNIVGLDCTVQKHQTYESRKVNFLRSPQPQQLSLFLPQDASPQYPRHIDSVLQKKKLQPDWSYKLIHFTHKEAQEILETTRYWDFSLDKNRIPKCAEQLRSLINSVVAGGDR